MVLTPTKEEAPVTPCKAGREALPMGSPCAATPNTRALLEKYGDSYMTFNPGMLDMKEEFSHGSLVKLCKHITASGLGPLDHGGNRQQLVARLRAWHDLRKDGKRGQKGNNFHFVRVKEQQLPDKFKSPFKSLGTPDERKSILRKKSKYSPAEKKATPVRTPKVKSPKSAKSSNGTPNIGDFVSPNSQPGSAEKEIDRFAQPSTPVSGKRVLTPRAGLGGATPGGESTRKRRLCFSPYNRVQLISPRRATPPPSPEPAKKRKVSIAGDGNEPSP